MFLGEGIPALKLKQIHSVNLGERVTRFVNDVFCNILCVTYS